MSKKLEKFLTEADAAVAAETPSDLVVAVEKVLADGFVFYFKAHTFHWNVEGPNFSEYHGFFGGIYEQVFDSLDFVAEEIRALGSYAPRSLAQLVGMSGLVENRTQLTPLAMIADLASDNQKILGGVLAAQRMADAANQVGLANRLQDLFDAHKKLAWQLSAYQK